MRIQCDCYSCKCSTMSIRLVKTENTNSPLSHIQHMQPSGSGVVAQPKIENKQYYFDGHLLCVPGKWPRG